MNVMQNLLFHRIIRKFITLKRNIAYCTAKTVYKWHTIKGFYLLSFC
jgi:hypothetical protein